MKLYDRVTPDGTKDLLFDECRARKKITTGLRAVFESWGYNEVITPGLEFFDVFNSTARYLAPESMFKLVDGKGRLMVIRPDCTIPIARLTATRLKNLRLPIRLYYNQDVYRISPEMSGRSNELNQIGVELIGSSSIKSDIEIIRLAARALSEFSGGSYRLEICHIGFFRALIDSLTADNGVKEEIRAFIESKNYAALSDLLDGFKHQEAAKALKALPRLFGGSEILGDAMRMFNTRQSICALDHLRMLCTSLERLGLSKNLIVDLGLVNKVDYYTGVIFRGYIQGVGEAVLSGGRYDNLTADFGLSLPATGFGISVDMLAKTMTGDMASISPFASDILVHAAEEYYVDALKYIDEKTANGAVCENSVFERVEEALEYARAAGIKQVHVITDKAEIIKMG